MSHLVASFTGIGLKPTVTSAASITATTVRVNFSEAMSPNAALLLAANYTFTPAGGSAARTAVSVVAEPGSAPTYVVVTLDGPATLGTNNYTVTVSNAGPTDLAGNTVDPAHDDATFSGLGAPIGGVTVVATPDTVQKDGGYQISVRGLSTIPAGEYDVHIGPLVSANDPLAYSGVQGQGPAVTVENDRFTFVSPILPVGGPYALFLVNRATAATITTSAAVTVTPADFRSATFDIRRLLPRWWRNGPRTLTNTPYPQ